MYTSALELGDSRQELGILGMLIMPHIVFDQEKSTMHS